LHGKKEKYPRLHRLNDIANQYTFMCTLQNMFAETKRVRIEFLDFGKVGEVVQVFGKKGGIISDGLCGTNSIFNEQWKFEILHKRQEQTVLIEWNITNLTSGNKLSRIETPGEAYRRNHHGRTICNNVVKSVFEQRAKELEDSLEYCQGSSVSSASLHRRSKRLRRKRCLIGLMFFGLQHKILQDFLRAQLMLTSSANHHVPNSHGALPWNQRKSEQSSIAANLVRFATENTNDISIGLLKAQTLSYAWEKFESNHPGGLPKDVLPTDGHKEQLPFLQVHAQPVLEGDGVTEISGWSSLSQLRMLELELVETFSHPPTPRSLDHYYDVWKSFTDIVLGQVEQRLRAWLLAKGS